MELRDEAPPVEDVGGEEMRAPDEVAAMLRLQALGWGTKRIAAELGCSRKTVRRYLAAGGWAPYRAPGAAGALDGLEAWLGERLRRHRGNADVVRQELLAEQGIAVSLRTVERAVARAAARAGGRGAGDGALRDAAGPAAADRLRRAPVPRSAARRCGSTCSWPRWATRAGSIVARLPPRAAGRPGSTGWRARSATSAGVPREVLLDNAQGAGRPARRARRARWRSTSACTPSPATGASGRGPARPTGRAPRARTSAASATSSATPSPAARFASWAALEAHLARWMREVADSRVHGTTGEAPIERFRREEAAALRPLAGRPPFRQLRELTRRVQADGCVELDTNRYSVPWRLIGERVSGHGRRRRRCGSCHAGEEVAPPRRAARPARARRSTRPTSPASSAAVPRRASPWPRPRRRRRADAELLRPLPNTSGSREAAGERRDDGPCRRCWRG